MVGAWGTKGVRYKVRGMTKWEYQVAPIPLHNEALMLNNFGQDGWELVTIQTNAQGGLIAFLKRPQEA
jgi:hypothetical protein